MAGVLASFAQGEIDKKGERHKAANYGYAARGIPAYSRRPFGYQAEGRGDLRRSVQVLAEVAALREMYRRLTAGETLTAFAQWLNESGMRTTTGVPFNLTAIRQLLLSPVYAGQSVYDGKVVGRGQWEPSGHRMR